MPPAVALQQAMRQMLNSGDPALVHPAVWAPFVVVGGEMPAGSGAPEAKGPLKHE
jgi:CHAT domain-containing protein